MDELNYQDVISKIKARFPEGTVLKRQDNSRAYIPNQVYNDRVESATESRWDQEFRDVEINIPHRFVKVIARVTIGPHFRDGIGFVEIGVDGSGKPKQLATAVDLAKAEAIREALDTWEIGWQDLAPYYQSERDWASNPALAHLVITPPPDTPTPAAQSAVKIERNCIICKDRLNQDEWELLSYVPNLDRARLTYCFEHIPSQYRKKIPQDRLKKFQERNPKQ